MIAAYNTLRLLYVACGYSLLFFLIPFWLRGFSFRDENVVDELITGFLYSNVIIISSIYLLALCGIFNRFTVIILLLLIAFGYRYFIKREQTIVWWNSLNLTVQNLAGGDYHPWDFLGNIVNKIEATAKAVCLKVTKPYELVLSTAIFGYAAYIRCYHSLVNLFFGSSEMYTHTEWIKYLMHNQPFYDGVCPYGFHAVVASVSVVFNINPVIVMHMQGPISGMLIVATLYYLLKRTMCSATAVYIAMIVYVVSDLLPFWASEGQFLALPVEFGTIFLYLTSYFFYQYLKEKKRSDLLRFVAAITLTMLIHYYITIFAALLCAAVFLFCLSYLSCQTFLRLALGILCALAIAVTPQAVGLLRGIACSSSMDQVSSFNRGSGERAGSEATLLGAGIKEIAVSQDATTSVWGSLYSIYEKLQTEGYFQHANAQSPLNAYWFIPYLAAVGVALLASLLTPRGRIYAGYALYSLLLCALYILARLEIFSLMEADRLYSFFIFSVPLVFAASLELLHCLLEGVPKIIRLGYRALLMTAAVVVIFNMVLFQRFMPLGRVWQAQYNGAVAAYLDIIHDFSGGQWIIVSSMTEYTQCLFEGYHYQMADFIMDMHDFGSTTTLVLPAENVFVYVVKRPNTYSGTDIVQLDNIPELPYFDPEDATVNLAEVYGAKKGSDMQHIYLSYNANRVLQAKADAWAREYMRYFPQEMSVYYDDDQITVYRIKQNPNAWNNFAIPYVGNRKTD